MELEQKWLPRSESAERMRMGLPEVDFVDRCKASKLTEPIPVGDAHVRGRWPVCARQTASAGFAKSLVALGKEVDVRLQDLLARDRDDLAIEPLQSDLEHWTVDLSEYVVADLDL